MQVYRAPEVLDVVALHPYLSSDAFRQLTIREQIAKQASVVQAAHAAGDRRIRMHVMCWWPRARGLSVDDVMIGDLTIADAKLTMAREYGYQDWTEVESLGSSMSSAAFEQALDAMLAGDIEQLQMRLRADPDLVRARSNYGHRSTLLHYIGANGVESHRQQTPLNSIELAKLLIDLGADPKAEANIYEGGQTAFDLASTSAHPRNAGIADDLNRVLGGKAAE